MTGKIRKSVLNCRFDKFLNLNRLIRENVIFFPDFSCLRVTFYRHVCYNEKLLLDCVNMEFSFETCQISLNPAIRFFNPV